MAAFSARIRKVGINPYVDPPKRVTSAFGIRGYIPVKGKLDGKPFRQTPVPIGNGRHRLFINGPMRAAARVDVGSRVMVTLAFDPKVPEVPMPARLESRLKRTRTARVAWDSLTPSRQKE